MFALITKLNLPGALLVWDVKEGHVKHEVKLDRSEMSQQITPKIMLPSFGSIITDFGHQLRIVRFPLHDKSEWDGEAKKKKIFNFI